MPRMPIAIAGDANENDSDLIGSDGLEFPCLARHAIDQSGNVSRQNPLSDQLREHLRQSTEHLIARARAPRFARPSTGSL